MNEVDDVLKNFYEQRKAANNDVGRNVLRACSEALWLAIQNCYQPGELYKNDRASYPTRLLVTLLNGGKSNASAVKFSKFYLVINQPTSTEQDVTGSFIKFVTALRKLISSTKQGEAGFKPSAEGSYFNALPNIADSFKMVEEAIN